MSGAIPVRDLKVFLVTMREVLKDAEAADRLLVLCERNERAAEEARRELGELAIARAEHDWRLAEARREHDEALRRERAAWDAEQAQRRRRLELDEDAVRRRRGVVSAAEGKLPGRVYRKAADEAPAEQQQPSAA
jgi:hypothetical protein